ncbi:dihydroorotate dehydrogenase family protein [Solidesulfovibrio carbinoliphilus subsp. oakridgensis]|uniref:Dihydroorotate dehydrogenase n=1 Tax=Solidesulfovibrio carbinoliphilus subsp. oakridgensis TaxID=694327 RepID=G7Q5R1_9BACT|nr:dihydroorotate dehydrogenase [Solidesulfovibrio carbinoliphilus]EHJ49620.1 dihydroorotate dehydrogenase family protein [Solidesulfovibrio carbinoliphilus subsp. oakridgensis]
MSVDTTVRLPGMRLKNPVMTASGTFGYGLEFAPYGDLRALGGIVVKGLSLAPRLGNPMPRIAETPSGMLNAIGLQNCGVEVFLRDKLPRLPHAATPIIANLYACDADEFAELAGVLSKAEGVAALEVNISCPNVKAGGIAFGQDPAMAGRLTEAVKKRAGDKPVWVKLSPNVTDIVAIARAAVLGGADALTCINTLTGMSVDIRTRKPRLANGIGGLSGPAIKPVALRCVWQVCRAVSAPVIAVGGISSAEDVLEFMLVGAHAVQIGTANFMRPDMAFRIAERLPVLMEELGIGSLDAYRGTLALPGA